MANIYNTTTIKTQSNWKHWLFFSAGPINGAAIPSIIRQHVKIRSAIFARERVGEATEGPFDPEDGSCAACSWFFLPVKEQCHCIVMCGSNI